MHQSWNFFLLSSNLMFNIINQTKKKYQGLFKNLYEKMNEKYTSLDKCVARGSDQSDVTCVSIATLCKTMKESQKEFQNMHTGLKN